MIENINKLSRQLVKCFEGAQGLSFTCTFPLTGVQLQKSTLYHDYPGSELKVRFRVPPSAIIRAVSSFVDSIVDSIVLHKALQLGWP